MLAITLFSFIEAMGMWPAPACPTTDPKIIAQKCELRCRYQGNTPVCWWIAKPGQQT